MESEPIRDIVVLYHGDCKDGFGAAWSAWKKFGATATYIPVFHELPVPAGLQNKEIYMLDFSYPEEVMIKLIRENKRVTAIEHHVTQESVVKLTHQYSFDNNHSGAVLAWRYFHPGTEVPKLLLYVEDQDLLRFDLAHTSDISSYINASERTFKDWSVLAEELEKPESTEKYIHGGALINKYNEMLVKEVIRQNARLVSFLGYTVYAVNAPHRWASYIGNALIDEPPPFVIIWQEKKDAVHVSLRSDPSRFDVAVIAQQFGGGGHKMASGFTLPVHLGLPWKIVAGQQEHVLPETPPLEI